MRSIARIILPLVRFFVSPLCRYPMFRPVCPANIEALLSTLRSIGSDLEFSRLHPQHWRGFANIEWRKCKCIIHIAGRKSAHSELQ